MKKVCCIVQYSKINSRLSDNSVYYSYYEIDRLTVITRQGVHIDLTNHRYPGFADKQGMYKYVMMTLKNNNFYVGSYVNYGATWYEIEWIDSNVKGSCERLRFDC